jgi:hypothetical protein
LKKLLANVDFLRLYRTIFLKNSWDTVIQRDTMIRMMLHMP